MLFVHTTQKLAKATRMRLDPAPIGLNLSWIDCWYANLFALHNDGDAILMTNTDTLYSFIIPVSSKSLALFGILDAFRIKLASALEANEASESVIAYVNDRLQRYTVCKTANRSVLGTMNEMIFSAQYFVTQRPEYTIEDIEASLNEMPLGPLKYQFSTERFRELVGTLQGT